MKIKTWLLLLGITVVVLLGYQYHARSVGKLEGQIKMRGEVIRQQRELAATKERAYQKAKAAYVKTPTLESCSVVLRTCEERHETDTTRISLLNRQITDLKRLNKRDKLFGFLPRPQVSVGYCFGARTQFEPCISAGFPILK